MDLRSGRSGLRVLVFFVWLVGLVWGAGAEWGGAVVWVAGAVARLALEDGGVKTDVLGFLVGGGVIWRREVLEMLGSRWGATWFLGGLPLIALALRDRENGDGVERDDGLADGLDEEVEEWKVECPRPWIFPCRTRHTRMFPKRHAFGYSYLLCGFPVVPAGVTKHGVGIGDGKDRTKGSRWLRIRAEDYLARGCGAFGFFGKLKVFMREQVCLSGPPYGSFSSSRASETTNGRMPTSSLHLASSATRLIPSHSGTYMIGIMCSRR